jgi:hypothetical protein
VLGLVLLVALSQVDPPSVTEPKVSGPNVLTRAVWSGAAGVAGASAALGIGLLLYQSNSALDVKFATAALAGLLLGGLAVTLHEALGGRGEVVLGLIASLGVMALSGVVAEALDGGMPRTAVLTVAMGALPAAVLTVLALEGTSPKPKTPRVTVVPLGTGLAVLF